MKNRIISIALVLGMSIFISSCEKYFEDSIATPNNPTETNPPLLLSNIEVATFANFGGQLARQTLMLSQQVAGTSEGSQTAEIMNYNITELTNENEWGVIYTGALMNGKLLIDNFGTENPHYAGIARILMAMNLGSATDLWGDVPFSDALNGLDGEFTPSYDTQEEILDENNPNGLFGLLNQAIVDLQEPSTANTFVPGTDDFIFGGDIDMWLKTAYSLKARYYNRLSGIDPSGSATKALNELQNAISASSENAMMKFGTGGNSQNQWYAYEQARPQYIKMGKYLVDTMVGTSDPRLPFYADPDTSGAYSGTPKDMISLTYTSDVGDYISAADAPIPLVSYTEMKFIEAEAKWRQNDPGGAATAFNDAVDASVRFVADVDSAAQYFLDTYANEDAGTISLEKIMMQKYVALFGQIEAYNDFRRTGLPAISPRTGAQTSTIPVRLIIPQNERLYNPNAGNYIRGLTEPVWWDK